MGGTKAHKFSFWYINIFCLFFVKKYWNYTAYQKMSRVSHRPSAYEGGQSPHDRVSVMGRHGWGGDSPHVKKNLKSPPYFSSPHVFCKIIKKKIKICLYRSSNILQMTPLGLNSHKTSLYPLLLGLGSKIATYCFSDPEKRRFPPSHVPNP